MALKTYQRYLVALIPLLIFGLICYYFSEIVTYIILAWVLSMIGAPVHKKLRPLLGNTGAAVGTLVTFSLVMMTVIWVFVPPVIQQARKLSQIDYEKVFKSLEEPIKDWNTWLIDKGLMEPDVPILPTDDVAEQTPQSADPMSIDQIIRDTTYGSEHITIVVNMQQPNQDQANPTETKKHDSFLERARSSVMTFLRPQRISGILSSIFGALGNTFIGIASVFFITFFFLKEQDLFNSGIRALSPNGEEDKWTAAISESANLLKRYFIGIILQITVITIFVSIVLSLLGFENALLIGFFAGLTNVIPYVGPFIGAAFAMIITISSSLEVDFYSELLPSLGIIVGVFAVMQMLDNFIVQPNIFSRSVKAHPLEIFIVILAGAKIGGVLGMVIAIPAYTVLRVLAKMFLSEFKIVQRITSDI